MEYATLAALAEPNRMKIVEFLLIKPASVGEIADRLVLRQPQASKHLKVLCDHGWVEAQPRSKTHVYQLRASGFKELEQWLESFRKIWEANYDRLDAVLKELKSKEKGELP